MKAILFRNAQLTQLDTFTPGNCPVYPVGSVSLHAAPLKQVGGSWPC